MKKLSFFLLTAILLSSCATNKKTFLHEPAMEITKKDREKYTFKKRPTLLSRGNR